MRVGKSIRTYFIGSFLYGWDIADRPKVFYHQTLSYLDRFILKRKPENRIAWVSANGQKVSFRVNWFDPRNLADVFRNDYNSLEPDIFKGLKTFIDVGANIGFISACVRMSSPGCSIICFEPLEENAKLCALNNPKAKVEVCGIGAKNGKMKLLVDDSGFMASSLKFDYRQTEREVKVVTLDGYLSGVKGFDEIDLIKIDVEGMEADVIKGGKKALSRTKRIVAEIHSDELLRQVSEVLEKSGFSMEKTRPLEKGIYVALWKNSRLA